MEADIHTYEKNHFLKFLSQVMGTVCGDVILVFNAVGKINFNNSDIKIENIKQLPLLFRLSEPKNSEFLSKFWKTENFKKTELFDYLEVSGKKRFSKIVLNSFLDDNNQKYYSVLIRRMGEDLCNECESKFKAIFLKAPVGIASIEINTGKILDVNPEFCKMLGFSKDELLTKCVSDITYPEDYKQEHEIVESLLKNNESKLEFTKRYIKKDGTILYANLTATLVKGFGNNDVLMGIILNATQNIKLLQAEKEKKSLIEKISLTTPDTLLIFDVKAQTFTFSNHSLIVNENESEELTFLKLISLIHPDDLKRFLEESNLLIISNDDNIHECSFRLIYRNNEIKWLLCRGIVFTRDETGYPEQILMQMTDITSQKGLEESLRQSYRQINEKNKILEIQKHELLQAKYELEKSERQLIEANLNKDKFFSIIAHDLKNPFNSLFGSASFLAQNFEICDNKDIKTLTDNIYNSAKVIYSLLENLLSWARLQTNRLVLNIEKLSISEMLNNIVPVYNETLQSKNINLQILTDSDYYCYADRYSIETVLRNLLSNAIKFSFPNSKIIIGIESAEEEIVLYVKDFGVGMTDEKILNIFTLSNNKTTNGTLHETGTGLGLLICKEFIEKNNGKIWVESKENEVTTFFISLEKAEKT